MYGILVVDYMEFARIPIWEYERPMQEKGVALKVITGYGYDGLKLMVMSITGNLYSLMINRESCRHGSIRHKELQKMFGEGVDIGKTYTLNLWNVSGGTSLFGTAFTVKEYQDSIPNEVVKAVYQVMEEYEKGIVSCSDCGEKVQKSNRQYFAGMYCEGCWEGTKGEKQGRGGWREVEANETYN